MNRYAICCLSLMFYSNMVLGSNQALLMGEHRLKAPISADNMNRMAVSGDRIMNVFGDEGTFVIQSDEQTGQVFIKPTAENALKPLSITLITENGLTQDLELIPSAGEPHTVLLKPTQNTQSQAKNRDQSSNLRNHRARTLQEEWIQIMRQAVLGELTESVEKMTARTLKKKDIAFEYQGAYPSGRWVVRHWKLKNKGSQELLLEERSFYQPQDVAISLSQHLLEPGQETMLYILEAA